MMMHTMRTQLIRLALPAALLLAAVPARAQLGNQSDPPPSGFGGAGGGSFLGPGLRTENELFSRVGRDVFFRDGRLGCALRTAESAYRDSVERASRTPSQARVVALLVAIPGTGDVAGMATALAHGADPASPFGQASTALARSLEGLMRTRCGCVEKREGYDEAPQWQEAIRAFNEYLRIAPNSAFSPPAPELVAIHDALQRVVHGALRPRAR